MVGQLVNADELQLSICLIMLLLLFGLPDQAPSLILGLGSEVVCQSTRIKKTQCDATAVVLAKHVEVTKKELNVKDMEKELNQRISMQRSKLMMSQCNLHAASERKKTKYDAVSSKVKTLVASPNCQSDPICRWFLWLQTKATLEPFWHLGH